ncbi:MAG: hypothetical protein VKL39_08390 [Leptolyngbyaceae bacterium]|nr:hypothetical protein [Leptolyngbyaceae bacterium]
MNHERPSLFNAVRQSSLKRLASPPTQHPPSPQPHPHSHQKRGRPSTGKRSNPDWVGRTFYIQRKTDLSIEEALLQLKCQGVQLDKSELVNLLLSKWSDYQKSGSDSALLRDLFSLPDTP